MVSHALVRHSSHRGLQLCLISTSFSRAEGWRAPGSVTAGHARSPTTFDAMKAAVYREELGRRTISARATSAPSRHPTFRAIHRSYGRPRPCQDLSLAGEGVGLGDCESLLTRSGAFKPWVGLNAASEGPEQRKPQVMVFENVSGALSSNERRGLRDRRQGIPRRPGTSSARCKSMRCCSCHRAGRVCSSSGSTNGLVIPTGRPHARPPGRLGTPRPSSRPMTGCHPTMRESWAWWGLPHPMVRRPDVGNAMIEDDTDRGRVAQRCGDPKKLVAAMSPANARQAGSRRRPSAARWWEQSYKRTRPVGPAKMVGGKKVQKRKVFAEVRFDGIAGCLPTLRPAARPGRRSSWLRATASENAPAVHAGVRPPHGAARQLSGARDTYNDGYHLAGDGVAVPVVRFLAQHLLEPLAAATRRQVAEI